MSEEAGARSEQATARRIEDARKKGQVAISRDLSMAAALLTGMSILYVATGPAMQKLTAVLRAWLGAVGDVRTVASITPAKLHQMILAVMGDSLLLMLPLMACVAVAGSGMSLVQTGFLWRTSALEWDFSRLDPFAGARKLLSFRSVAELIKASLKVLLIATVSVLAVRREFEQLPTWIDLDLAGFLHAAGGLTTKVALWAGGCLTAIAAADYAYQRFEWQRGLKMTKQEVKEEHRDAEGDPMVRSRVRSVQKEMARKRMMTDVPKADVVITNPTHIAVALRYAPDSMAAPVVVAKGAGYIAERIKKIAREHGVMVVEQPLIARSLYKLVAIGREVPADLYRAVAEILAMVYRAKGMLPNGRRVDAAGQGVF